MNRSNLTVLTHAQAKRLLFDGKQVTGVEFWQGSELKQANAEGEVILSAGAIGSPQILQVSGVGPGGLLREHGIEVRHELTGVGENLQDHLQMRLIFKVQNTVTLNQRASSLIGKARMALEYALTRSGPMSMAPSQLGAFTRSDPSRETPNLEYHVQPLSLPKFGEPLHSFPAFTASVCNLRPDSRGTVKIRSADPREAPAIKPNYLSGRDDQRVAVDAIKLTRRICQARALQRFQPEEFLPGPGVETEEQLVRAAGDIGTTIFHPVSTCKMGQDDTAVVDERLRVRGLSRLRIADASIMPTITSGNTNSPTMMIAEKAAAMILEDTRD